MFKKLRVTQHLSRFFIKLSKKSILVDSSRRELMRSFFQRDGRPGQSDPFYFLVLIGLVTFLNYFIIGSGIGVFQNSVNILLKNIPGHGAPIKFYSGIFNNKGLLDHEVNKIIDPKNGNYFPTYEVEDFEVSFPHLSDKNGNDPSRPKRDIQILAVLPKDPLWLANNGRLPIITKYLIDEKTIKELRKHTGAEIVITKINTLKNKSFKAKSTFQTKLSKELGELEYSRYIREIESAAIIENNQNGSQRLIHLSKKSISNLGKQGIPKSILTKLKKIIGAKYNYFSPFQIRLAKKLTDQEFSRYFDTLEAYSRLHEISLDVILNRSYFQTPNFDCKDYKKSLEKDNLPKSLIDKTVSEDDNEKCFLSNKVWLKVSSVDGKKELVLFDFIWSNKATEAHLKNIGILISMPLIKAVKLSRLRADLVYYPESKGASAFYRTKIFYPSFGDRAKFRYETFYKCLGTSDSPDFRGSILNSLRKADTWITACIKDSIIADTDDLNKADIDIGALDYYGGSHTILHGYNRNNLYLPCHFQKRRSSIKIRKGDLCLYDEDGILTIETGVMYVKQNSIFEVIRDLDLIKDEDIFGKTQQKVVIHPDYRQSLIRVDFISTLFKYLTIPYFIILCLLLIGMLISLIDQFLYNRKETYQNLLSIGASLTQLRRMMIIQLSACWFISSLIVFVLSVLISIGLNLLFPLLLDSYKEVVHFHNLNIFTINWLYLLFCLVVEFFVILISYFRFRKLYTDPNYFA